MTLEEKLHQFDQLMILKATDPLAAEALDALHDCLAMLRTAIEQRDAYAKKYWQTMDADIEVTRPIDNAELLKAGGG